MQLWSEAGTVMLGKLATHEFAMGGPSFDLPWPPARNPWNPEHFTAGSSSGTGAAVASGQPSILHVKFDTDAISPGQTLSAIRAQALAKK